MTSRTHDLATFTALNILFVTGVISLFYSVSLATVIVAIGVCFLGGITPDIDQPTSAFWHKLPAGTILGKLVKPFLGAHRHLSHSILGLIVFGWVAKTLLVLASHSLLVDMNIVWLGFMLGLVVHLIMDSFTHDGVPWLFPIPFHFGFPPIKMLRLKTGGFIEKVIVFPGLILLNGFLFYRFYPTYLNFFHSFGK